MLGYMTEKQAAGHGFTHHGSYYGIPCWLTDAEAGFMVATKWAPMELVMSLFHGIEGLVRSIGFPGDQPHFQFTMGKAISREVV